LNGNHALLAKVYPLQCHPRAKHCSPCKEVSVLARALAAGSAAESEGSDKEVADRLTLHINLWTNDSWSDHCASHLSHIPYFVQCVGLYMEMKFFN